MKSVVIIGAGPAGLTAAYQLSKHPGKVSVTVIEADPKYVGGISKTVQYKNYRFDIGGHRFFSKSADIEALWTEILGPELITRPRKSRIYFNGKFFGYPLKPFEALIKLGIAESVRCVLAFLRARLFPIHNPRSFEDWVTNQFGSRLFQVFFKTYTEKVWGMSCKDISADWAAQRIKGLSLSSALLAAFKRKPKSSSEKIKTLIDSFRYPRLGPGQMWEVCASLVRKRGGRILMGTRVSRLEQNGKAWRVHCDGGTSGPFSADHVILSSPMAELAKTLPKEHAEKIRSAALELKYRDFITVVLIVKRNNGVDHFDDNWIYIHDPGVQVGRIQNFRSWSPDMVPNSLNCCYGLEYFCLENDHLWLLPDEELIRLGTKEFAKLGFAQPEDVLDGCVVRQAKAYPVYDHSYRDKVETIRRYAHDNLPGLHFVGRNGMHKYNNQDHSMMTAWLTAENILQNREVYDIWQVNEDAEYHEAGASGSTSGLRLIPQRIADETQEKSL